MNKCVYAFFLLIIVMLVSLTGCVGSVGLPPDSNMASVPSSSNTEKHSEPTSTGTESSTDDILSVSIEAVEDQVAKAGSYCQYINDENGIFLVISPNAVIRSFRFVTVQVDDTELGLIYSISDELYSIDELTQDKPFWLRCSSLVYFLRMALFLRIKKTMRDSTRLICAELIIQKVSHII